MRLALAAGVAIAALSVTAAAQERREERVIVHAGHGAGHAAMDADEDGFITRAEASAAADRMFSHIDSNRDNRLTREDHEAMAARHRAHGEGPADPEHDPNCDVTETERDGRIERRVECRVTAHGAAEGRREIRIERHEGHGEGGPDARPPHPPGPPHAMHGPMFMMMAHEEADRDGDGALSQEEFRAQHLRFFDAADVNGDGRLRAPAHPPRPATPQPPPPARR